MVKKLDIPKDNNIIKVSIDEAMPDNYLPYAVEVAKDRALPDVRDGLKPVQRRILYGAYLLKAFPDKPYYKSARIVGDILGKFHPHGDSSVYDAMVILAQDFTTRMPLIDGHGNWGSIDGDSAAAMRYTEARLTNLSMEMISDIDKDVVNMVENYSGTELEPEVLPAKYPNLLVNGAFGIAVGLATNIPPHNLKEVIDAVLAFIDNKNIDTKGLMQYVKGPDLPTGGILIGKNALLSAYETGEGKVTLRAKADIEKLENGRLGIVIKEFPFRKSKARLLQTISEMTEDKRHAKALEAIADIRDESDRTGIRAVIELKKSADTEMAEKILKYLYKKTDLQSNIAFNMVALSDGKPQTLGLKAIISHYVEHRKEIVTRRTKKELETAEKRFHIVEGFIKAIGIMDDIIKTIRASKSKQDAENNLQKEYGFSEIQAQAIVELMLYRLTGLEVKTFKKEYADLEKLIKKLKNILENEKELLKVIKKELIEVKDKYGDARRTEIIEDDEEAKIDIEELVVVEDIIITLSNEGFIKRIPLKSYNRSGTDVESIEYREGDFNKYLIPSNTKDSLMLFTDKGNMYQLKGINIPECKWKEKGEKLDTIIKGLDLSNEKIVSIYNIDNINVQKCFIFITTKGCIKKTDIDKFNTSYSKIQALKLKEEEKLVEVKLVDKMREENFIKITTKEGLDFTVEEPKLESADRTILGLQLFNLPPKDEVVSADFTEEYEYKEFYLGLTKEGVIKEIGPSKYAAKGTISRVFTSSTQKLMIFFSDGNVIKLPSYMLQNIGEKGISIDELLSAEEKKSVKFINMISVSSFSNELELYFFTKNGLMKKTILKEFNGNYYSTMAYKLKTDKDELICIKLGDSTLNKNILIVTKRAMSIRFETSGINPMGRVASGVTAISLKEDDEVIFAALIYEENVKKASLNSEVSISIDTPARIILKSTKKNKKAIEIKDIKLQNRAGRGSNLLLVVLDDYIEEVIAE